MIKGRPPAGQRGRLFAAGFSVAAFFLVPSVLKRAVWSCRLSGYVSVKFRRELGCGGAQRRRSRHKTSSRLTAITLSSTKNNATFIVGQINIIMSHGVPLGVLQILSNVKLMRLSRNLYDISYMRCPVFFLLPMVTIHLEFPRCMYDTQSVFQQNKPNAYERTQE